MSGTPNDDGRQVPVAVQIAQMVVNLLMQLATMFMVIYTSGQNHEKITQVETRQERASDDAKEVKQTLDTSTKRFEDNAKADAQATEINLWSSWKYLDSIAAETGASADVAKASEAKKAYELYRNRKK